MNVTFTTKVNLAVDPFDHPDSKTICFSMLRRLRDLDPHVALPEGFQVDSWFPSLIPASAALLRVSFIDSKYLELYPQLESRDGCTELISELVSLPGFLPEASWLISREREPAGVILATRAPGWVFGQIHVVAVSPRYRNQGLGSLLVNKSLEGFIETKLQYAVLNICRTNRHAIRFFRKLGFTVSSEGEY